MAEVDKNNPILLLADRIRKHPERIKAREGRWAYEECMPRETVPSVIVDRLYCASLPPLSRIKIMVLLRNKYRTLEFSSVEVVGVGSSVYQFG